MDIRKNAGIVLIVLGMVLTMDRTKEFAGIIRSIAYYFQSYWPLMISFLGIYLLSLPKKKK